MNNISNNDNSFNQIQENKWSLYAFVGNPPEDFGATVKSLATQLILINDRILAFEISSNLVSSFNEKENAFKILNPTLNEGERNDFYFLITEMPDKSPSSTLEKISPNLRDLIYQIEEIGLTIFRLESSIAKPKK